MASIKNAAPRSILQGIEDDSIRQVPLEPEATPIHLPHMFLFTERGPEEPQLVSGYDLVKTYGAKSFDVRGEYSNHQTQYATVINGRGNAMMVQRMRPDDAKTAGMRVSLDLLPDMIPQYTRNTDGSFKLDQNGVRIPTGSPSAGFFGKLVVEAIPADTFGLAVAGVGTQTTGGGTPVQSTKIPLFDLEAASFGKYGDLLGMRFSAPTTKSANAADEEVSISQKTALYRIQFVERPDAVSVPNIIRSAFGEQFVDFSLKAGAINPATDVELFVDDVVIQAYNELDPVSGAPTFGPFGKMHVYHDDIEGALIQIHNAEKVFGSVNADPDAFHLMNIFSAVDINAVPYHAYAMKGPLDGGALFNENTTQYAKGGADGEMTFASFDALVANECANYGDLKFPFLDRAKYPQSTIWDSGFTLETKKKLLVPMGRRKDIWVALCTQDVSQPQNSSAAESSIAIALRAAARLYPESEIYGTSVCRAIVMGHSGHLLGSKYRGILPLSLELADKIANWAGASNGVMKAKAGPDAPGNNRVKMFKDVNEVYKTDSVRNRDWDSGLVWVDQFDRRSLFWPAFQTVYDEDTSILNSLPNMIIATELEKVADRVWRELTGISGLTADQFIKMSNDKIYEFTKGRFDSRVTIVPETYFTAADTARGYSWATKIYMYGSGMRTVGSFTIVPRRIEDLTQ